MKIPGVSQGKGTVTCRISVILVFLMSSAVFSQSGEIPKKGKPQSLSEITPSTEPLLVKTCGDFKLSGNGNNVQWDTTEWYLLSKLDPEGADYNSKFKILASDKGLYVLFQGEDQKITTKNYQDMDKIWNGDVYEMFIHTDTDESKYFEYEVNQFGKQLLLTISNEQNGVSWIPFNEYGTNTYGSFNEVEVVGGPRQLDGKITSWSAEVFLSYKSLGLLSKVPPKSGTVWNANFCRLDHDTGKMVKWSWTPAIENSLHELDKFRTILFE